MVLSLFIDVPLTGFVVFVNALIELELYQLIAALFQSIKFQFGTAENDFHNRPDIL
jgi:hypothetical protein